MFALNKKGRSASRKGDCALVDHATGLVAGTKVATQYGWRVVEAVAAGDQVLTFDGGLQTVVAVHRTVVWSLGYATPLRQWPLHVPAGALGNREDMTLMPDQAVFVESDTAEAVLGDPFAMIPARSLDGFRGITAVAPAERMEIVTIEFDQEEVVFANIGALFHCPKNGDLLDGTTAAYPVLSLEKADLLVSFLEIEDQGHVPVQRAAMAFQQTA